MRSTAMLFTSAMLCASSVPANAISWSVQLNCANDYYAYCSMHTAGSPGCHACMRTNRPKLSSSCVSALIEDGVLPKVDVTQQKSKSAVAIAKAKSAPRSNVMSVAKPIAKSSAKVAAVKPTPKPASMVANAARSAPAETHASAPEQQTSPPQQPAQAALAIDQQTFEAFKNRAPYFLPAAEIEAANAAP